MPVGAAERRAGILLLSAFGAGAVALTVLAGAGTGWVGAFVVLAVLYAIAGQVEFEVGTIHTDCSLASLAAMVVALPPAMIPWCVAAGATLGALVNVAREARHVSRVIPAVAQLSLPVLAPAAILAASSPVASWSDWPAIGAALGAYLLADLISSKVFARLAYGEPLAPSPGGRLGLRRRSAVGTPRRRDGDRRRGTRVGDDRGVPAARLLLRVFADERRSRIDQALELSQAYRGTAMLLGDVVETDDAYTGSHSRDVVELAVEVGRRMGLGADALRDLEFGALLHDVGKIAVPKEIINKPGKLTRRGVGDHEAPHDRRAADARERRRRARTRRGHRARVPRGFRR